MCAVESENITHTREIWRTHATKGSNRQKEKPTNAELRFSE